MACIRSLGKTIAPLVRGMPVQVAMQAPMLLGSTSVKKTLKPRVELLQRDIGLPADALPGIIARCDTIFHVCVWIFLEWADTSVTLAAMHVMVQIGK